MGGGHRHCAAHRLLVPGDSPVHRLAPTAKVVGLVVFVVLVAVTPRTALGVLALDALVVVAVMAAARLRPSTVLPRLGSIVPFVAFALALPVLGTGSRADVLGMSLSVDGLWAAWNIVAKAGIGASAGIVLTATTPLPELVRALGDLHLPRAMVSIVAVMLRYLDLLVDQLGRMRRAMTARGHDPRWLWQAKPIAASVGTLFVRTYERGERVHLAMVARGYDGALPAPLPSHEPIARPRPAWGGVPAAIAATALAAWLVLA